MPFVASRCSRRGQSRCNLAAKTTIFPCCIFMLFPGPPSFTRATIVTHSCRHDKCRSVEGHSAEESRFVPSIKNDVVIRRNDVILKLFDYMLDCCLDASITQVVRFWERCADHIGLGVKGSTSPTNMVSFPAESIFLPGKNLTPYCEDPSLWAQDPPWCPTSAGRFVDSLKVGDALLPELAPTELKSDKLSRMVCVLLDIARYRSNALKERSLNLLVRMYNQWSDLRSAISTVWIASTRVSRRLPCTRTCQIFFAHPLCLPQPFLQLRFRYRNRYYVLETDRSFP